MEYAKWIIGVFLIALVAVPLALAAADEGDATDNRRDNQDNAEDRETWLSWMDMNDPEALSEKIQVSPDQTDTYRERFLLWTNDIRHYMAGRYGNGYFTAMDDAGNRVYGIYSNGFWAGIYEEYERPYLFFGTLKNDRWTAYGIPRGEPGIFGLTFTHGRYDTERPLRG